MAFAPPRTERKAKRVQPKPGASKLNSTMVGGDLSAAARKFRDLNASVMSVSNNNNNNNNSCYGSVAEPALFDDYLLSELVKANVDANFRESFVVAKETVTRLWIELDRVRRDVAQHETKLADIVAGNKFVAESCAVNSALDTVAARVEASSDAGEAVRKLADSLEQCGRRLAVKHPGLDSKADDGSLDPAKIDRLVEKLPEKNGPGFDAAAGTTTRRLLDNLGAALSETSGLSDGLDRSLDALHSVATRNASLRLSKCQCRKK